MRLLSGDGMADHEIEARKGNMMFKQKYYYIQRIQMDEVHYIINITYNMVLWFVLVRMETTHRQLHIRSVRILFLLQRL